MPRGVVVDGDNRPFLEDEAPFGRDATAGCCAAALIGVSARERARRPFCQVRVMRFFLSFSLSLSLSPRGKADKRVLFLRSNSPE